MSKPMPYSCKECGDVLGDWNVRLTGMVKARTGERYPDNRCKPCFNLHQRVLAQLHKTHPTPPPGSKCQCCGRIAKLQLDHCHATFKFRGFLCQSCNHGIGQLGDDKSGVQLAVDYLKRANDRDDAESAEVEHRPWVARSGGTSNSSNNFDKRG